MKHGFLRSHPPEVTRAEVKVAGTKPTGFLGHFPEQTECSGAGNGAIDSSQSSGQTPALF